MVNKGKRLRGSFAYFIAILLVLCTVFYFVESAAVESRKEQYKYIAMNQANKIGNSIERVCSETFTAAMIIQANQGKADDFTTLAPLILKQIQETTNVTVKNIALAPKGKVTQVYPLKGNESFVGFDMMDKTKTGNQEAIEAYHSGKMVLTNPFPLVQGGQGISCRLPVFLSSDDGEKFWGIVSITMDYDRLVSSLNLEDITNMGIDYQLSYKENSQWKEIGASKNHHKDMETYVFDVENLKWRLSVSPDAGWWNPLTVFFSAICLAAVALLLTFMRNDKRRIKDANKRLEEQAYSDALTRCYTRQYVNSVLVNVKTGQWNDPDAKYSMAIVDIDRFKEVNDTYGHEMGDRVITCVAEILQKRVRQEYGDCVIRHGGDEFVLLFNDVTPKMFKGFLDDVIEKVHKLEFTDFKELKITVSIGGCQWDEENPMGYYYMVREADEKLYLAKESGKDQWMI